VTDPRRLLDNGSEASPALRVLLASAKRSDDPRAAQIEELSARLAVCVEPLARSASITPAPHAVATAVARASRAAIAARAVAAIVALGVLCGGAWYLRAIHNDARTQVETRRMIERDARQTPSTGAPPAQPAPDDPSIENVVPQPSPAPSPDSASAAPRPAAAPKQPRGSDDSEAETKLVVAAGAALVRDEAKAALVLTRKHLAQFPNGGHAEERDRIAIEALVRLGGLDRARAAADRFFLRYPQSIYRSRIENLLR
jgi:hypothetical protein